MAFPLRPLAAPLALAVALMAGPAEHATAAPPGAIPFHCHVTATIGALEPLLCRRSSDRVLLEFAQGSNHLLVTDIHVTSASPISTGAFRATIGREAGGAAPSFPSIRIAGEASRVNALHFTTPYIVLEPDETLAVSNDAGSDVAIEVFISGYMSENVAL